MLVKRIFYYLVGLSLGSIAVYFFWQKKNASFDYGMDARTLKTIRIKERIFSDEAKRAMLQYDIDTLKISTILYKGDVDFSKSNQRIKPCPEYYITGNGDLKSVSLYVKRCDSIATIEKVIVE
ncbi:hypothetical protein BTO04_01640 [Polaribacter sp. SA4-10]|uniref:DUF4258 domain-containing protein n=1 Tax=Polaribacter sp. SA4-10 TaxID=754397 RepID=UPI000B3CC974|nr:DUF4258 domain-containing protein [Polaribacter sp. SA4-10]ARV05473.1 hypothetical protein BTO04_01640 [Polaribacter sp. SA4-10]